MKKIAVIQFPGSNCERESMLALKRNGLDPIPFLWNQNYQSLAACDGFFIVGGFSYEDRSRAGVIASLDPLIQVLKRESEKGKPVLGICNGAQVLVETGMVPGLENYRLAMALDANRRMSDGEVVGTGFYNGWVNVKMTANTRRSAFTSAFETGEVMNIPVAHAEGRFVVPPTLLSQLKANDQLLFRYVDETGEADPNFPVNPNGSVENLAAVCNPAGNVMAMMPHPERTTNGDKIFSSLREYLHTPFANINSGELHFEPSIPPFSDYEVPEGAETFLVDLIITDKEAVSVEQALTGLGHQVKVKRQTHWELGFSEAPSESDRKSLLDSGELFNSNKEKLALSVQSAGNVFQILVRHKEGAVGQQKLKALQEWFGIKGLRQVRRGILWTLEIAGDNPTQTLQAILNTHILYNPYAHECCWYRR